MNCSKNSISPCKISRFCAKRLGLDDVKKAKMMDALKSIYYPDEDFDWHEI